MLIDLFILVLGAFLIWGGANYMTDGSSALARRWGVNEVVIGITIVAFGSSAPDLAVCLLAVFHNHEGLALGNVVGSNVFDVFMVVGVCWLVKPLKITDQSIVTQTSFMVLVYIIILIFSNARFLDHDSENLISRSDGLILLIFYGLYMYAVLISQKKGITSSPQPVGTVSQIPLGSTSSPEKLYATDQKSNDGSEKFNEESQKFNATPPKSEVQFHETDRKTYQADNPTKDNHLLSKTGSNKPRQLTIPLIILYIIGGLGALIGGGEIFVKGATGIARDLHISETMIGLTVVALGTSLPDLATSLVAVLKKENGLAMGNVIGSCLFDGLIVLGACSLFKPLPLGTVSNVDLLTMLGGGLFFWLSSRYYKDNLLTRIEGTLLIIGYVAYTLYLIFGVAHL